MDLGERRWRIWELLGGEKGGENYGQDIKYTRRMKNTLSSNGKNDRKEKVHS